MSTLVVDRLRATSAPELRARTRSLLAAVAERRLADALRRNPLPEGDWCVRRLDLVVRIDPARPDPSLEDQWAGAIVDTLQAALRQRSSDVVHYPHRAAGLVDLVTSVAIGDLDRAWAWKQAGLLAGHDVSSVKADPAEVVLAALGNEPHTVVAVLVQVLQRVGLPRLHRLLGVRGWPAAAALAAGAARSSLRDADLHRYADSSSRPFHGQARVSSRTTPNAASAPELAARLSEALAVSTFAATFRSGVIRPDASTLAAWAVLALAEADPAVLRRSDVAATVELAAGLVTGDSNRARPAADVSTPAPGDMVPAESDALPARWATVWGGLLFLLSTASEAGVPDGLIDDPVLAERPLSWSLHAVASRLVPAAADDPAMLVFAGLPVPSEPPSVTRRPPGPAEGDRLDEIALAWARATAERLGRESDDPFEVVRDVALRRGEIAWEPGWVEVHLRLEDVDVEVRRAGLDLDPGWVPWLGTVVRFVHD